MAEGWTRHLKADSFDAFSAGIKAQGLNPYAVKVMDEAGVDISGQRSQTLDDLDDTNFDLVITVCSHADANCPTLPGAKKIVHHGFDDPPKLAESEASEEGKLQHYRRVRDEIREYIESL